MASELERAVDAIIEDLCDRRALRQTWESIDSSIRDEIRSAWIDCIQAALARQPEGDEAYREHAAKSGAPTAPTERWAPSIGGKHGSKWTTLDALRWTLEWAQIWHRQAGGYMASDTANRLRRVMELARQPEPQPEGDVGASRLPEWLLRVLSERGVVEIHEDQDGNVGVFDEGGILIQAIDLSAPQPDAVAEAFKHFLWSFSLADHLGDAAYEVAKLGEALGVDVTQYEDESGEVLCDLRKLKADGVTSGITSYLAAEAEREGAGEAS